MKKDVKSKGLNLDDTFSITMELERPLLYDELRNEVYIQEENEKSRKIKNNILKLILGFLIIGIVVFFIWANDSYKPQELAENALVSDSSVQVNVGKFISFTPKNVKPTKGFIFYPGAKVEPEAYAPLCKDAS